MKQYWHKKTSLFKKILLGFFALFFLVAPLTVFATAVPVAEIESLPEKEKVIMEEWVEKPLMVLFMQII